MVGAAHRGFKLIVAVHCNDMHHVQVGKITSPTGYAAGGKVLPGQPCLVVRESSYQEYVEYSKQSGDWPSIADPFNYRFFEIATD